MAELNSDMTQLHSICLSSDGKTVDQDLPCRGCEYNLRTQAVHGRCPECGCAVAFTIADYTLALLNPSWLRSLTIGAWLLSTGFVASLFLVAVLSIALSSVLVWIGTSATKLGLTLSASISLTGIWLFTSKLRSAEAVALRRKSVFVRLISVVWFLCFGGANVLPLMISPSPARLFYVLLVFFSAVMAAAFVLYCIDIARILRNDAAEKRCVRCIAIFGIGFLLAVPGSLSVINRNWPSNLITACFIVGICIMVFFGLMILVLPNRLIEGLKQARKQAEATITEFQSPPVQTKTSSV